MLSKLAQRLMKPDPRRCEETRALMSAYVEEDLEDGERRSVDRHVRFCPRCRTVLQNLRHTVERLRRLGRAPVDADVESAAERVRSAWRELAYPAEPRESPGGEPGSDPHTEAT